MTQAPPNKQRVMVDANVLVAGSACTRSPYEVIQHAVNGDYQLVLSIEIIEETRTTLAKLGQVFAEQFEEILSSCNYEVAHAATPEEIALNPLQVRDPKDIHVAVSAVETQVTCLVTHDKDLTENDLLKQQVEVILPAVFLRMYMGWSSEQLEAIRHRNWEDMDAET